MIQRERLITTSWDDGSPSDWRIAELLQKHKLRGTFYIPRRNAERSVMPEYQIRELSQHFEIGGHTLNHVRLDRISPAEGAYEIQGCQEWLSDVLGFRIACFCYPGGRFKVANHESLREAGFMYARTVQLLRTDSVADYCAPTTLQFYQHPLKTYIKNVCKRLNVAGLKNLLFDLGGRTDLGSMTNFFLQKIDEQGGVFHLWGHSWEVEENDGWQLLDEILALLANRPGYRYVTNGELPSLIAMQSR